MARRKQSRGTCEFCGKEMTRGGLTRHLSSCVEREKAIAATQSRAKDRPIYHLIVSDAYGMGFWLHLEISTTATLNDLDFYLRGIWLECCGHLSAFDIPPYRYTQIFNDGFGFGFSEDRPLTAKLGNVLSVGDKVRYQYDFGSTTELVIEVKHQRVGKPLTKHPVLLMARNEMPETECMECEETAEFLCIECIYEDEASGYLCAEHADSHPHEDYGEPMQLGNSPRMGVCAYEGPSDPPY